MRPNLTLLFILLYPSLIIKTLITQRLGSIRFDLADVRKVNADMNFQLHYSFIEAKFIFADYIT